MLKYPLAILLLASLAGVAQAQSGTRGGVAVPQGSGARGSGARPMQNSSPSLNGPAIQEAPLNETYSIPNSGSGTRGQAMSAPYVGQSQTYAPARSSNCGQIHSYYVPVQTYYVPRAYYRPYYGRRHRCSGY